MSVDSWTLLGAYLRNLTLNWLVLVPLLATVLLAPRLLLSILHWKVTDPMPPAQAMLVMGLLFGLFALTHLHMYRPSLDQLRSKRVWERFERQQWFLIGGLTPLVADGAAADHRLCLVSQWRRPSRPAHPVRPR